MDTDKLIHAGLSEAIVGAAMKVLNTLRPDLNEKARENAWVIELRRKLIRWIKKGALKSPMKVRSSSYSGAQHDRR